MTSQKCQMCNNTTTNPSGLCYLHENASAPRGSAVGMSAVPSPSFSSEDQRRGFDGADPFEGSKSSAHRALKGIGFEGTPEEALSQFLEESNSLGATSEGDSLQSSFQRMQSHIIALEGGHLNEDGVRLEVERLEGDQRSARNSLRNMENEQEEALGGLSADDRVAAQAFIQVAQGIREELDELNFREMYLDD